MPRLHRGRIDLARGTPTLVQAALQHKKMQAMQCKKAMQQFAHGSAVAAAKLRAALDEFEACASTSATREARRALEVAQERLDGEESKERAHGNPPFLSAAPRSEAFQRRVECDSHMKRFETHLKRLCMGRGGGGRGGVGVERILRSYEDKRPVRSSLVDTSDAER